MSEPVSLNGQNDLFRGISGAFLRVRDVAGAAAFYQRLGLVTGPVTPDFTVVLVGASQLFLYSADQGEYHPEQSGCQGVVLQVEVTDVDALYRHVLAVQIPLYKPLNLSSWGAREFVVEDADGYLIAFWQAAAELAWRPAR